MTKKLKEHELDITAPQEIRAKRSAFIRQLHYTVGQKPADEIQKEIETHQPWLQIRTITKIKDYTHVLKIECGDTQMARKVLDQGLLAFGMFIPPYNIKEEEYIPLQTCFQCYKFEQHTTKTCPDKNQQKCSECAGLDHRWEACKAPYKKCLNCGGPHRTLAMQCPVKKEAILTKKTKTQETTTKKNLLPYNEAVKTSLRDYQPPKTELVLQHDQSFSILTACILAHLHNVAEPGTFNVHLNRLLKLNNLLPEFNADPNEPSHKLFNIAELTRKVSSSQTNLLNQMEEDILTWIISTNCPTF